MPRPRTQGLYFGENEEAAVRVFLTATTWSEKNKVYNDNLRAPLNKMIDSIIRRYKLYRRNLDFRDIHADTLSFLITKADKFKPEKGKKAYSYFGTICKNYLMGQIMKDQKELKRKISYEDISTSVQERDDMVYHIDDEESNISDFIKIYISQLKVFMSENKLSENENKVGLSLIDVFENFERIFIGGEGNKFNKNVILYHLREMTGLTTKEIRMALRRYKVLYGELISQFRNE